MELAFTEQRAFAKVREDLFGDDEGYRAFQNALMSNPRFGDVIPGTRGVRKIRWLDPTRGKGKRGGIRVIYYYCEEMAWILLLTAYDKNTPDLSPDQKKDVRAHIASFRKEIQP